MSMITALAAFAGLLLLAILVEPWARRMRLPFSAVLVVAGFLAAEAGVWLFGDIGLRWHHFRDLVLHVLLPVLVFESALRLEPRALVRELAWVLILAVPSMLVAAGITAVLVYYGIGHPAGFPWLAALIAAVLLSATDPVAVVALFRERGAPRRLETLVEGESLLNDAGAIVLFTFLAALASGEREGGALEVAGAFAWQFVAGLATGAAIGLLGAWVLRRRPGAIERAAVSLVSAFFAFVLAERVLHASGVLAVLAAGLAIAFALDRHAPEDRSFVRRFWGHHAFVANALVFLLLGATVTVGMFTERWLAMLIGIGAVLLARGVVVYGLVALLGRATPLVPVTPGERHALMLGGLRGAVTIALALSLPVALEGWWTVQSIAYGVVLFTLFVQAPAMRPLLDRFLADRD